MKNISREIGESIMGETNPLPYEIITGQFTVSNPVYAGIFREIRFPASSLFGTISKYIHWDYNGRIS